MVSGQEKALEIGMSVKGDFVNVFSGGAINPHDILYLGIEHISLTLNTEACRLWKGGTLILDGLNTHGARPSADFVKDLQVFSNIEAGDYTGFYELNFQQKLGKFQFLIGQHDLNVDFCLSENATVFFNSSFGVVPTLSLNVPVAIFPVTGACIIASYEPWSGIVIHTSIYDGNPGNIEANNLRLNWSISHKEGILSLSEFEYNHLEDKGYNVKVSGYYHSGIFRDNSDTSLSIKGNYGFCASWDQTILKPSGYYKNGINMFIQLGLSPADRNIVRYYLGAGLTCHGLLKKQVSDILGIAVAHTGLSEEYRKTNPVLKKYETTLEGTYQLVIGKNFNLQPALQYIINPGAIENVKNAFIGTLRFNLMF